MKKWDIYGKESEYLMDKQEIFEEQCLEARQLMVRLLKNMWERRLTNAAGGNLAVRVAENRFLVTPTKTAEHYFCNLKPAELLLVDGSGRVLEGDAAPTKEMGMHLGVLQAFPMLTCTLHAHPFYAMPFIAASKAIPSLTEATAGRGDVQCISVAPDDHYGAGSQKLAASVLAYFLERKELVKQKSIGCILPGHGVVITGKTPYDAYSMLERMEADAYCATMQKLI